MDLDDVKDFATSTPSKALAAALAPLAVLNYTLPFVLKTAANKVLEKLPGFCGALNEVSVHVMQGRLALRGLRLEKKYTREKSQPFFSLSEAAVHVAWPKLIGGGLVAEVVLEHPVFEYNYALWTRNTGGRPNPERRREPGALQAKIKAAFPFQISRILIKRGTVRVCNLPGQGAEPLRIDDVFCILKNLTNDERFSGTLEASAECRAQLGNSGRLEARAKVFPLAAQPTFDADAQLRGFALAECAALLRHYLGADVESGTLEFFTEGAAAKGEFKGYVKPVLDRLRLRAARHQGLMAKFKARTARIVAALLRNKKADRIATRVPFEGAFGQVDVGIAAAIGAFLKNAFQQALRSGLDPWTGLRRQAPRAGEVEIDVPQKKSPGAWRKAFGLFKTAMSGWSQDEASAMAAALSYYTAFSLAPLLILVIAIAGLAFGRDAAQGRIIDEIGGLVGSQSAHAIQSMIAAAWKPGKGVVAAVVSVLSIIAGAMGVLSQLKQSLNRIWRTREAGSLGEIVKTRAKYLGMILGIGFLLLVSLAVSAGISAFGHWMQSAASIPAVVPRSINVAVSLVIIACLFALMFKYLPDVEVGWKDAWVGGGLTAVLFSIGRYALGVYLGKGTVGSSYGAAGSVLIVLLWVYYSALILYYGAEFTRAYAHAYGSHRSSGETARAR